jgi:hypothetical protein
MDTLVRTLRWPVTALLLTGAMHFVAEALRPDLRTLFTPATLAPILLLYGLWVGFDAARRGRGFVLAIVAGAILGTLPVALDTIGFGILLGRGLETGAVSGAFGWLMIVFGSLAGGGIAMSRVVVTESETAAAVHGVRTAIERPA